MNKTDSKQVELSIIVCTRNRAKQLATLIQCLGSQKNIESLNWEIVIVDNNSTDNTREVAYAFCEGSNLKINYIFESKIGLSNARNTGILTSKGSLILFIDDDVLIPKEFLSNALFGIQEFPEFQIFGFKVLPDWDELISLSKKRDFKPPFWLSLKKPFSLIQSFLPIHDLGSESLQYPNRIAQNPIGACFLIKKEVFERLGPFREDLGAGQSGVCEDTEYFWYALMNNLNILYWPYAVLYHPVMPERLTVQYLHKWYFNLGKSLYLVKNTGRLQKESMLQSEGKRNSNNYKNSEVKKLISQFKSKSPKFNAKLFKISLRLWLKLFLLIFLLPFSIVLILIKRPFYFSTLLSKNLGEITQAIKSKNKY